MSFSVKINGADVEVEHGSLSIETRIEERSIAAFDVIDVAGTLYIVRGMPVEIYDGATCIFGGFIDIPERKRLSPGGGLLHSLSCMDNHYLTDKRLVVKAYENKTLAYIVNDIWTDYLGAEGITIGEVQTGPTIKSAIFNYVKASEAFDALKELSGFIWFIDEYKKLYFVDRASIPAPWHLDATHKPNRDVIPRLEEGNPLYRNVQYKRGGLGVTDLRTETFTGDGQAFSFTMGYPLAKVPVITENGASKTVGIKGLETGKDYYWSKGDSVVIADTAPAVNVTVAVKYYGQYPLMARTEDYSAILERQAIEGGSGIIEDIVVETQHESSDALLESAGAMLRMYCQDAQRFQYETSEAGLAPSQLQSITYSPFGFDAHEMLIESVTMRADGDDIRYLISCIMGPSTGSWAKLFSNILLRQDKAIRIGTDKLLVLLHANEALGAGLEAYIARGTGPVYYCLPVDPPLDPIIASYWRIS